MKKILLCAALIVASFTSIAQVGIGTATPDASAALDIESTTKGFLPPRMTLAQINAIATPVEGLMVYCLDGAKKGLFINNGIEFINVANGESIRKADIAAIVAAATNTAGSTLTIAQLEEVGLTDVIAANQTVYEEAIAAADPQPTAVEALQVIIDTVNNKGKDITTVVEDIIATSGSAWMDRNLGATQVATSSTDAAAYGDLYQWGRAKDGHESRTSNATTTTVTTADVDHGDFIRAGTGTDNNWTNFEDEDSLWQNDLNDPCSFGYRVPTDAELQAELDGFSPAADAAGAFSSNLKLSLGGRRNFDNGVLNLVDFAGYYWSSTISSTDTTESLSLIISSSGATLNSNERARGLSVRCIKKGEDE